MNEHETTQDTAPQPATHDDRPFPEEEPTQVDEPTAPGATGSGLHPVNVSHLVMGTAFVGLAVVWAVLATTDVTLDGSGWLLPLPWVLAGAVGLLASVFVPKGRWRRD